MTSTTSDPTCIEYIPAPAEFEPLVKRVLELVKQIAGHEWKQALVLETADHQIHEGIINVPYDADETLLNAIGKDNAVVRLVCCWADDGGFDMPAYDFSKRLCDFNEDNQDAEMLLMGEKTFIVKTVRVTMPQKT